MQRRFFDNLILRRTLKVKWHAECLMSDPVKDTFRYGRNTRFWMWWGGGLSLWNTFLSTTGKEHGQFLHLHTVHAFRVPWLWFTRSILILNIYFAVCALLIHSSVVHELWTKNQIGSIFLEKLKTNTFHFFLYIKKIEQQINRNGPLFHHPSIQHTLLRSGSEWPFDQA